MSAGRLELLHIEVTGRPAPQGSKDAHMREQSRYLPAWRAAVKRDVYRAYRAAGIEPDALPLYRGAVAFGGVFHMSPGHRFDGPPDLDKLLRSTWDACTAARLWEDDARVTSILEPTGKVEGRDGWTGAVLTVMPWFPGLGAPARCRECLTDDEDPAPWCDCRTGEECGWNTRGPCRNRAHEPMYCRTPGRFAPA